MATVVEYKKLVMKEITLHDKIFTNSISSEEIDLNVSEIACQLNLDYINKTPILIGVLNGSFMFLSDLVKKLTIQCEISFVKFSSYSGLKSTAYVKELIGFSENLTGKDVIIVEDIIDSGTTMECLLEKLNKFNPSSVKIATFCFKPNAFIKNFEIDYVGMNISNDFIVGYGMDYDGLGRNLKEIYKLKD